MKIILAIFLFFIISVANVNAHSGRTDSSGGHNCYVGACAGTYHYHNGGSAYQPPSVIYYSPTPIAIPLNTKATYSNEYDSKTNKYSIKFDWEDIYNSGGYSVSLSKYQGSDPGPLVDTYNSVWRFNRVNAGKWYANLKSRQGNTWSQIVYWTVDLPVRNQPTKIPTRVILPTKAPYVCNCAKTCTQIGSCTEAYYQLNNCGCSVRDGDNDGVPCENLCN